MSGFVIFCLVVVAGFALYFTHAALVKSAVQKVLIDVRDSHALLSTAVAKSEAEVKATVQAVTARLSKWL